MELVIDVKKRGKKCGYIGPQRLPDELQINKEEVTLEFYSDGKYQSRGFWVQFNGNQGGDIHMTCGPVARPHNHREVKITPEVINIATTRSTTPLTIETTTTGQTVDVNELLDTPEEFQEEERALQDNEIIDDTGADSSTWEDHKELEEQILTLIEKKAGEEEVTILNGENEDDEDPFGLWKGWFPDDTLGKQETENNTIHSTTTIASATTDTNGEEDGDESRSSGDNTLEGINSSGVEQTKADDEFSDSEESFDFEDADVLASIDGVQAITGVVVGVLILIAVIIIIVLVFKR